MPTRDQCLSSLKGFNQIHCRRRLHAEHQSRAICSTNDPCQGAWVGVPGWPILMAGTHKDWTESGWTGADRHSSYCLSDNTTWILYTSKPPFWTKPMTKSSLCKNAPWWYMSNRQKRTNAKTLIYKQKETENDVWSYQRIRTTNI